MRTAEVCPTCATFTNALCVLYVGPDLPIIGMTANMSIEEALINIEAVLATLTTTTTSTSTSTSSTTTTTTTAPA